MMSRQEVMQFLEQYDEPIEMYISGGGQLLRAMRS